MPQLYIEGNITDANGTLIANVSLQLATTTGVAITQPVNVDAGSYSAWTDRNPDTVNVVFKKKGYQDLKVKFSELMNNPDVILKEGSNISIVDIGIVVAAIAVLRKQRKKVGAAGDSGIDANTIFLIVGGLLAFSTIQKILERLGLGADPTSNEQTDPGSPWKPGYWQQFSSYTYAITTSQAKAYSQTIHNAFGIFQDDYNAVLSVFNQMRTKANVSYLAYVFAQEYNEDLLSFLTDGGGILPWDGLSTAHLKVIIDMVSKLPTH